MTPEDLLVTELLTIFESSQLAPAGTYVYEATGDPITPYCLYRRTSTHIERDLSGTPHVMLVEFNVSVESKFFSDVANVSMPDYWESAPWTFELTGVEDDQENFRLNYTYLAAQPL